jgi:hypothetical protein
VFLVVLLLVEGWRTSPASAGLVVTEMPLATIAAKASTARSNPFRRKSWPQKRISGLSLGSFSAVRTRVDRPLD